MSDSSNPRLPPTISVRGLHKRYGGTHALRDVSMDFKAGALTAICGENGAGKSTLMKILAGLERPTEGSVHVHGQEVTTFEPAELTKRHSVALVPQELALCPHRTVADNVLMGIEPGPRAWPNRSAMNRVTRKILERLGTPIDPTLDAGSLDVATQQLVVLARALARQARVLILDEPTSVLSPVESDRLFTVIESLREEGVTMLYVSHRMPEIFRLADDIQVLRDGTHVATMHTADTTPEDVVAAMVGRELGEVRRTGRSLEATASPALELRGFNGKCFHDVDLTVHSGELVGIAGLPDSGRTELLRGIFGADRGTSGDAHFQGAPLRVRSPQDAIDQGVAFLPGERRQMGIFPTMSVADNVNVLTLKEHSVVGFLQRKKLAQAAEERTKSMRVKVSTPQQGITQLSGGNQQKALLARWLAVNPQLLLLDDPTRGVDVGAKAEIYELFTNLAARGVALLVSSSDLPELLTVSDRIVVMREGRVVGVLDGEDATEEEVMALATGATQMKEIA